MTGVRWTAECLPAALWWQGPTLPPNGQRQAGYSPFHDADLQNTRYIDNYGDAFVGARSKLESRAIVESINFNERCAAAFHESFGMSHGEAKVALALCLSAATLMILLYRRRRAIVSSSSEAALNSTAAALKLWRHTRSRTRDRVAKVASEIDRRSKE